MIVTYLFTILVGSILTWIWVFFRKQQSFKAETLKRNLKYVPQISFLRAMLFKERIELHTDENIRKVGRIYGTNLLNSMTFVVAEPDLVQIILNKEFANFPNRRRIVTNDPFFKNALSVVELDQWKRLRAIVAPTFATGKLRKTKPNLDLISKTLVNNLENFLKKSDDKIVNIKNFAGAFTMDTIIQVALGVKVDSLLDQDNPIIKNAKKLFGSDISLKNLIIFTIMFTAPEFIQKLLGNLRSNAEVVDFFTEFAVGIIEKKRKEFAAKDFSKACNFIEFLLEAEHELQMQQEKQKSNTNQDDNNNDEEKKQIKYMTNDEMLSQCVLFLVAGYDTTATAITITSYFLALNPDKQKKAYEDVLKVLSELDDPNCLESIPFEWFNTNKFEYVSAAINEALRLSPPAAFIERRAAKDMTLKSEDGKLKLDVKKDEILNIPAYSLHRIPEYFPNPEEFIPERFCSETGNKFPKYAYLPFGSGPRACVAKSLALLEAKMAIVWLIKHYKLSKCDKTPIPLQYYNQGGLLIPRDIFLKVERR